MKRRNQPISGRDCRTVLPGQVLSRRKTARTEWMNLTIVVVAVKLVEAGVMLATWVILMVLVFVLRGSGSDGGGNGGGVSGAFDVRRTAGGEGENSGLVVVCG